jgi:hypothetical protein
MAIFSSFGFSFIFFGKSDVNSSCFFDSVILVEIGCLGSSAGFVIPTVVRSFLLSLVAFNL